MSYLVLARKFRPQTFASIIGQDHVTKPLANAIIRDRVPHALLFCGPRGVGKTSCARVFARAINCTGRELDFSKISEEDARDALEPCGECANCQEIAKSTSIAVREVDGASNNSVDNVRELIESLRSLPPPGSKYKIYIIDEVHMLSTAAFNALLKSLEEPPPNTIFIFATTEPHKIPETVASRCQRYDFRALTPEIIASCLKEIAEKEGVSISDDVVELVSKKAQGGMRDAQSMFDRLLSLSADKVDLSLAQQLFGVIDKAFFTKLSSSVLSHDVENSFLLLDEAFHQSLDIRSFCNDFILHWRNVLIVSSSANAKVEILQKVTELSQKEVNELRTICSELTAFDAQRLFDLAEQTARTALSSPYPRYVFEAGVAKMSSLQDLQPVAELTARLESLASGASPQAAPKKKLSKSTNNIKPTPPPAGSTLAEGTPANSASANTTDLEKDTSQSESVNNLAVDISWQDFVKHVQVRKEVMLAAYLRRASPLSFVGGELKMGVSSFDAKSLQDADTQEKLKSCLYSYSGQEDWKIVLEELEGGVRGTSAASGSMVADEEAERRDKRRKVEQEARSHPMVKAALNTFEGSAVERVSIKE